MNNTILSTFGLTIKWQKLFSQIKQDNDQLYLARVLSRSSSKTIEATGDFGTKTIPIPGKMLRLATDQQPTSGDWIVIEEKIQHQFVLHSILPRSNLFVRKRPGRNNEIQVIAANLDRLFVVMSMNHDFNLRRLERFVSQAHKCKIPVTPILSKADLAEDPEIWRKQVESLVESKVVVTCAFDKRVEDSELGQILKPNETYAFVGSSGVGKSSLINFLSKQNVQDTGEISMHLDKGKHTTTSRFLIPIANGSVIIDTPGMREFALTTSESDVSEEFMDIEEIAAQCYFSNCQHLGEKGCAINQAISEKSLRQERLDSYARAKKRHTAGLQAKVTRHGKYQRAKSKTFWEDLEE